jgi:hypothetical protein
VGLLLLEIGLAFIRLHRDRVARRKGFVEGFVKQLFFFLGSGVFGMRVRCRHGVLHVERRVVAELACIASISVKDLQAR